MLSLENISQAIAFSSFKSADKAHICLLNIKSSVQAGPSTFLVLFMYRFSNKFSKKAKESIYSKTWGLEIFMEFYSYEGLCLPMYLYIFPHEA